MLFKVYLFLTYVTINFAIELNFYSAVGQVRQEILISGGLLQTYFPDREYNAIVPGTIDFPGQKIIEQDLYNSNEGLRNTDVLLRYNGCETNQNLRAELVDPYLFIIKHSSSRYSYVSRDQIEFLRYPSMDGMILSVRVNNLNTMKINMTYLTRGLWWTPRYEIIVINDESATLRALADINNEHERSFDITNSQLITGTISLAGSSVRVPAGMDTQRLEYMANPISDQSSSISSKPESTSFGTYYYNITRPFKLLPKSIKTFPFLSANISFNYTLEATTYLSSGTNTGLFQRIFIIKPSEFLPAGTVTFYLSTTGLTLGQGRLIDTPKQTAQKISLGTDPDVKYTIISMITTTRQTPTYAQDANITVIISNRKENQAASVTLTMNTVYRNTILTIKNVSSSNIKINQNQNDESILIIQAIIKPNQDERCMLTLKQSS